MQGSHVAALVHDQTYRTTLRDLVQARWPEAEVYDPFANHATSVGYDMRRAREVFLGHVAMCREFDLLVAWVPEASMGTAIEMWEACRHARTVVTITPPDCLRRAEEIMPCARLLIVPHAGHMTPLEAPEVFNRALLEFLQHPPGVGLPGLAGRD